MFLRHLTAAPRSYTLSYTTLFRSEHVTHLVLTWDTILIGMGLGVGTALLSAAWPTLTALRLSPLAAMQRSEEHTSELQSRVELVCRLPLEEKSAGTPRCCGSSSTM